MSQIIIFSGNVDVKFKLLMNPHEPQRTPEQNPRFKLQHQTIQWPPPETSF